MLVLAALLVVAPAAAGRPAATAEQKPLPAWRECVAVQVTSPGQPSPDGVFSASRVYDLQLRALVMRRMVAGPHLLELRLYTPNGHLYQALSVPFSDGWPAVNATLPVAGTAIMTSSLYGRWRVEPHLDGSSVPCGRSRSFVIQQ